MVESARARGLLSLPERPPMQHADNSLRSIRPLTNDERLRLWRGAHAVHGVAGLALTALVDDGIRARQELMAWWPMRVALPVVVAQSQEWLERRPAENVVRMQRRKRVA